MLPPIELSYFKGPVSARCWVRDPMTGPIRAAHNGNYRALTLGYGL